MMVTRIPRNALAVFPRSQQGVVLLVALIVLVAMTLAALSLVRSIDTGNQVAGNLAFKQGATAAADGGVEAAIDWLVTKVGTPALHADVPAQGYYATSQDTLDITGTSGNDDYAAVDWDNNNCNGISAAACIKPSAAIDAGNGNSITYIIHRLCVSSGDPNSSGNSCANFKSASSTSPKRGEIKYGDDKRFEPLPAVYYRITSRVKGPKNTVSFVETIVHF
ncbi:pilus assembly PilX family protein [Noviherbaspirillum malthae]|uniref:pilus assembly PilX family protein n=1 Tax=Noviherbaspirillum malthae TaxID=1260987 RepID=UPI0018909D8D|nr:pilus assembly protein PilX [Noviherbaspirillum malthae]